MKRHVAVIALLTIAMTLFIAGASSSLASAQVASPCTATLSASGVQAQYTNSNAFVVPVFVSCPTNYVSQLYATGTAYDVTSNTAMGSASTMMASANGGTQFNGQLAFNTPPTSVGDSVQVSVSVYDGQGGNLLATTGETIPGDAGLQQPVQTIQQVITTTVTVGQYPSAEPYPTAYPSTYPTNLSPYPVLQYPQQTQARPSTYYYTPGYGWRWYNNNFFNYVAIIAIIAAVIIATTGLVLIARRRQPQPMYWYPAPPPPSR